MTLIRRDWAAIILLWIALIAVAVLHTSEIASVVAAPTGGAAPLATATPAPAPPCVHISTADTIKIYRCLDQDTGFEFYANNLGFMLAEPY